MSRIIIGVDRSERSEDAVAFGGMLARTSRSAVTIANAYPWEQLVREGSDEYDKFLRQDSERMLARLSDPLRDLPQVETRALPDPAPARALQRLAEEQDAGLVVLGSSHTGRFGRVLPGSTAERLLHGAPCPVAVVPHGFHARSERRPWNLACGWDGTPSSDTALATAEDLARAMPASLRVVRAREPHLDAYPHAMGPGYVVLLEGMRENARRALEERTHRLAEAVRAEATLVEGDAARALIEVSRLVDLLVIGSRGFGPLRAVLLGGVSGQVIRAAACTVIVVPASAGTGDPSVFAAVAQDVT